MAIEAHDAPPEDGFDALGDDARTTTTGLAAAGVATSTEVTGIVTSGVVESTVTVASTGTVPVQKLKSMCMARGRRKVSYVKEFVAHLPQRELVSELGDLQSHLLPGPVNQR